MPFKWGAYIIDSDGTLHKCGKVIPGAKEFLMRIIHNQTPFVILSNTGVKSSEMVATQLSDMFGLSVDAARVYTARDHMINAIHHNSEFAQFLVVGNSPSDLINEHNKPILRIEDATFDASHAEKTCIAIFTDGDVPDYYQSMTSTLRWMAAGATMYVTSMDSTVTGADGHMQPGPGVFVLSVLNLMGWSATYHKLRTFGKGNDSSIGLAALKMIKAQGYRGLKQRIMIIGDRLDTDIRFGNANCMASCLVETGCHKYDDVAKFPEDHVFLVARSIRDLCNDDLYTIDIMRFIANVALSHVKLSSRARRVRSVPYNMCDM